MSIDRFSLDNALRLALKTSCAWAKAAKPSPSNSLRSSRFCSDVGIELDKLLQRAFGMPLHHRQISVLESGKRKGGEWLLDIVWTEDCRPDDRMNEDVAGIPVKIWCAAECESNTSAREFFRDLSKLLQLRSPIKLFLGGLNQRTEDAAERYRNLRLQQITDLIIKSGDTSESTKWYVGFWPSPKGDTESSLWDQLQLYPHLNRTYLYYMDLSTNSFIPVEPTGGIPHGTPADSANSLPILRLG